VAVDFALDFGVGSSLAEAVGFGVGCSTIGAGERCAIRKRKINASGAAVRLNFIDELLSARRCGHASTLTRFA
jgi:hypothetical protein